MATSSLAALRSIPKSPAVHRSSSCTMRPGASPSLSSASRNTAICACASGSVSAYGIRAPTLGMRSVCCAGAASGQAIATPPRSVKNSRRLMSFVPGPGPHPSISLRQELCCAAQQDKPARCLLGVIFVRSIRFRRSRHVRFAPIASEPSHRSNSTRCAKTHAVRQTAFIRSPRRRRRIGQAARRGRVPSRCFRLITNSNLVACTTGRSAGLAPLRMRPA